MLKIIKNHLKQRFAGGGGSACRDMGTLQVQGLSEIIRKAFYSLNTEQTYTILVLGTLKAVFVEPYMAGI